jgi:hypothetical protein
MRTDNGAFKEGHADGPEFLVQVVRRRHAEQVLRALVRRQLLLLNVPGAPKKKQQQGVAIELRPRQYRTRASGSVAFLSLLRWAKIHRKMYSEEAGCFSG